MDIIIYLDGFYGPGNTTRDDQGDIQVFVDEATSTGVSLPSRYRYQTGYMGSDDRGYTPFLQHLSEVALGYGEPITVTFYDYPNQPQTV